jgi:hypothetical protein
MNEAFVTICEKFFFADDIDVRLNAVIYHFQVGAPVGNTFE